MIGGEARLELLKEPETRLGIGGGEGLAAFWPVADEGLSGCDWSFACIRCRRMMTATP